MTRTLDYYRDNASIYIQGTLGCMMDAAINEFLKYVEDGGLILDFGCGSGRDSKIFIQKGYEIEAVDGTEEICKFASEYLNKEVRHLYFEDLDDISKYDGIWACSSVLHLPYENLKRVIGLIYKALKPGGAFYASFRYGDAEGMRGERYFTDMTESKLEKLVEGSKFRVEKTWVSKDVRLDRSGDTWLNAILIK